MSGASVETSIPSVCLPQRLTNSFANTSLSLIPTEVLVSVLHFLSPLHILNFSTTCKASRLLCNARHLRLWGPILSRMLFGVVTDDFCGLCSVPTHSACRGGGAALQSHLDALTIRVGDNVTATSASLWSLLLSDTPPLCDHFRRLLATALNKIASRRGVTRRLESHCEDGSGECVWLRHLVFELDAMGFDDCALHLRIFGRGEDSRKQGRSGKRFVCIASYCLAMLEATILFCETPLVNLEDAQEACQWFATSEEIHCGLRQLEDFKRRHAYNKLPQLSMTAAVVARDCVAYCDAVGCAAKLSEISDHPNAAETYGSLWGVERGNRIYRGDACHSFDDPNPQVVPALWEGTLSEGCRMRLRTHDKVAIADIVMYYTRCLSKKEQQSFRGNVESLYRLAMANV